MKGAATKITQKLILASIIALLLFFLVQRIFREPDWSELRVRSDFSEFSDAMHDYRLEYGRWIHEKMRSDEDLLIVFDGTGNGDVVARVLDGEDVQYNETSLNRREIKFTDLVIHFVSEIEPDTRMLDPWKNPYRMWVDANGDGKIVLKGNRDVVVEAPFVLLSDGDPETESKKAPYRNDIEYIGKFTDD